MACLSNSSISGPIVERKSKTSLENIFCVCSFSAAVTSVKLLGFESGSTDDKGASFNNNHKNLAAAVRKSIEKSSFIKWIIKLEHFGSCGIDCEIFSMAASPNLSPSISTKYKHVCNKSFLASLISALFGLLLLRHKSSVKFSVKRRNNYIIIRFIYK